MMFWNWNDALDGGIGGLVVAIVNWWFCRRTKTAK